MSFFREFASNSILSNAIALAKNRSFLLTCKAIHSVRIKDVDQIKRYVLAVKSTIKNWRSNINVGVRFCFLE